MSRFGAYMPDSRLLAIHLGYLIRGHRPSTATPRAMDHSALPYALERLVPYVSGDFEHGGAAICLYRNEAEEQLAFDMVIGALPPEIRPSAAQWTFIAPGDMPGDPLKQDGIVAAKWLPAGRAAKA